jgi:arylsulfatase A-like enzyme
MDTRTFCLAALLGVAPLAASAATPAPRPNVVLILSDDQGWTDYGFMGHPVIRTPHLDRLAAESLLFTRGYTAAPLCRPALASLITGRPVHEHRICGNDIARPGATEGARAARNQPAGAALYETLIDRIETVPTLPRLLAPHGYRSFQAGKWWEGASARGGFTEGMTHGDPARGGRHGDDGLTIGREAGLAPVARFLDDVAASNTPFFLWYAPMLPHDPHDPPAALLEDYRTGRAVNRRPATAPTASASMPPAGSCSRCWRPAAAHEHGHLLHLRQRLDQRSGASPTASRRAPSGRPTRPVSAPPSCVSWPGRIAPRRDDTNPVSNLDFLPTVLALLDLEAAGRLDRPGSHRRAGRGEAAGCVRVVVRAQCGRPGAAGGVAGEPLAGHARLEADCMGGSPRRALRPAG